MPVQKGARDARSQASHSGHKHACSFFLAFHMRAPILAAGTQQERPWAEALLNVGVFAVHATILFCSPASRHRNQQAVTLCIFCA